MFVDMRKASKDILTSIIELVYFMRGGLQYHDAFRLTPYERETMGSFIDKRLEIEGKKLYQVY